MTVLTESRRASKRFGSFTAVDSLDLHVSRGEVVGLLGANGAGKTTLIRLLLGLLRPDEGSLLLFGEAPSVLMRRRVGYVPQTLGLYNDLTVEENWRFASAAFGVRTQVPEAIGGLSDELVRALPLGAQRQVAFAVALAHRPDLLVLDEPTSGVGPLGRARLWQQIRGTAEEGAGVLVTTHNLEEAEQCDRLVVMAEGRSVASGTVEHVVSGRSVVQVRCRDWPGVFRVLDEEALPVELHGTTLRVNAPAPAVREALGDHGLEADVDTVLANLEEAFVQIVSGTPGK